MKNKKKLVDWDNYDESMLNEVMVEGLVGTVIDKGKYEIVYITNVYVYEEMKTRYTFKVMVWKEDFKCTPKLKFGDTVVVSGRLRVAIVDEEPEVQIVADKIVFE